MKLFKFEKVMLHVVLVTACIFSLAFMVRMSIYWISSIVCSSPVQEVFFSDDDAEEACQVVEEATEAGISYYQ